MATVNTGNEHVLVIDIHNSEVTEVRHDNRSVYENTKGRFIKTVNDGQIMLTEDNHAIIATRRVPHPRDARYWQTEYYTPPKADVERMLHQFFDRWKLGGLIK